MPWVSNEDYDEQVERITADLFTKSKTFRQTIVYREMVALALKGAAVIGIANVVALVGIYYAVYAFMERTVAEKATKAVTDRNEAVNKSIETLTTTAISQIASLKSELAEAQKTMADGKARVAETLQQADEVRRALGALRKTQVELSTALKTITDSAFLNDPKNIDRVREFVTILSKNENATIIAELRTTVRQLTEKTTGTTNRDLGAHIRAIYDELTTLKARVADIAERAVLRPGPPTT
jgi:IS5 family transposase